MKQPTTPTTPTATPPEPTFSLTEAARKLGLADPLYARRAARSLWGGTRTEKGPWKLTAAQVKEVGAEATRMAQEAAKAKAPKAAETGPSSADSKPIAKK